MQKSTCILLTRKCFFLCVCWNAVENVFIFKCCIHQTEEIDGDGAGGGEDETKKKHDWRTQSHWIKRHYIIMQIWYISALDFQISNKNNDFAIWSLAPHTHIHNDAHYPFFEHKFFSNRHTRLPRYRAKRFVNRWVGKQVFYIHKIYHMKVTRCTQQSTKRKTIFILFCE